MAQKQNIFGWVPNFITSLNIVSGVLAIFFAIDGHLALAGLFILVASLFDFLDGFAARLLHAYSEIGKQLDSLADIVSFGVAPAAILFTMLEFSLFGKNQAIYDIQGNALQWLILASAFLIPVFSALRLAKFNIDPEQSSNFRGLPTPANAILWASFGLVLYFPGHAQLLNLVFSTKNLVSLTFITSFLLVSNIPMFSLKFKNLKWHANWFRYFFILGAIILGIFLKVYAMPLVIAFYILFCFVLYLFKVDFE